MTAASLENARRSGFRTVRPAVLIVGDGESERRYFDEFRRMGPIVRILSKGTGKTGFENTLVKARGYAADNCMNLEGSDRVAIVTDLDYRYDANSIRRMEKACDSEGFELYLSNPCFEVWLLLHYMLPTRPMRPEELNDELSRALGRRYVKSRGIPWDRPTQDRAVENSRLIQGRVGCTPEWCLSKNPSTMVHLLVESIRGHGNRCETTPDF